VSQVAAQNPTIAENGGANDCSMIDSYDGCATVRAPITWDRATVLSVGALLRRRNSAVIYLPGLYGDPDSGMGGEWEQKSFLIHTLPTNSFQYSLLKRIMDIAIVCAMLPCILPLCVIAAAIVRLSSPGPILYRHKRVGRFGREFHVWKFRSMFVNANEILQEYLEKNPDARREWAATQKLRADPRVTRLGSFLRKTSLDELPQLINVLAGSMSLVGPRPIVTGEKTRFGDAYFFYTSARPGLSGLWQVSGRSDLSYEQRIALDESYVRNWSLIEDIRILWRTAGVVWGSRGAV
jgi:lipopolysaccharide/colanic/teichoic acid biosynthesis glycosyltransferase